VPLYRGGTIPATVAARRAAYIGSIGSLALPKIVLDTALEGHPSTAVTLRFAQGPTPAAFSGGKAPRDAQSLTTNLHNGWTVRISAAVPGSGVLSNESSLALLIGGIALSVLLGLLGAVLATGRTRARRLVNEQTITLRDQAAELRDTVDELEAAQAIKDEFLALVSHELRTPLTSICGYTEMLQGEQLADEQHDYVNVIERNATRLLGLVEDILLMTRIQTGGLPLELGDVILNDLIARSGDTARPFAASKEIDLDIDSGPNIATQGDPTRLGQVLDNLVSNAIKYTPNGGEVSITMTRMDETATITVTDNGIGIPSDEHGHMFDRFFRTSNARNSGIPGTGLGLAIAREIVEGARRHNRLRERRGRRHDLPHHPPRMRTAPASQPRRRQLLQSQPERNSAASSLTDGTGVARDQTRATLEIATASAGSRGRPSMWPDPASAR